MNLLQAEPPFEGDTPIATATKHITDKPEKLSVFRPDIPKGIENAVLKLLHKYPKDRFKNAEDLRAVLLQQKTQLQAMQTQENLVDLTSPKIKYRFTLPALIISLTIVIGTGVDANSNF
jgi:serine/threonine-protein kinase